MWPWTRKVKKQEPIVVSALTDGDDYSAVDSRGKAEELSRQGKLALIYLMPREAGGPDGSINTVYVPVRAKQEKERIDSSILEVARNGGDVHYRTNQSYKGASFVPAKITISVTGALNAEYVLRVW